MALLIPTRTAQTPSVAEFLFNFNDTMVNTAGNTVDFGAANLGGAAGSFDILGLPIGAIVVGGRIITTVAFDTAGYDVILGDSVDTDRYHATADLKGLGTVALLTPGYFTIGNKLRLNFTSDDVCTTGQMLIQVEFIIRGRGGEVLSNA
jgi:hypothetical protein